MKKFTNVWMVVMAMVFGLCLLGFNNSQVLAATDPISIVKNGTLDDYPEAEFGKAADAYFQNGKWIVNKEGTYVTYTGVFSLNEKDTVAEFTFKVDTAKSTFSLTTLKYAGKAQSKLESQLMVYAVMDGFTRDTKTNEGKAVNAVKDGEYEDHENIPYGFVVQNFLTDTKWKGFLADDKQYYVDVTGVLVYDKKEAKLLMQYVVDIKTGKFSLNFIEMNGKEVSEKVYEDIQEAMLDELGLE